MFMFFFAMFRTCRFIMRLARSKRNNRNKIKNSLAYNNLIFNDTFNPSGTIFKNQTTCGRKNDFTQPTVGHHERLRSCLIADYVL